MASTLIIVFKLWTLSFSSLTNDSGNAESCAPLSIKAKYGFPSILTKVSFAGPINLAIRSGLWYSLRILATFEVSFGDSDSGGEASLSHSWLGREVPLLSLPECSLNGRDRASWDVPIPCI